MLIVACGQAADVGHVPVCGRLSVGEMHQTSMLIVACGQAADVGHVPVCGRLSGGEMHQTSSHARFVAPGGLSHTPSPPPLIWS